MPTIYDTVLSSQTYIEQLKSQGYSEYLISMALANAEIERAILKTNGVWTKRKLNALKKLIEIELLKAYGGLFESIQEESVEIAKINFEAITATAGITASLPKSAVQDLVNSKRLIQGSFSIPKEFQDSSIDTVIKNADIREYEFEDLLKGTQIENADKLKTILAGAVSAGKTPQQIANDVIFRSNALSKGQIRKNIFTILVDSKNQAVYNSYEQIEKSGLDLYYEHVSVLDGRTSDICIRLDDRKYFVPFKEIPTGLRPPIHISCRSQLVQRVKDFTEDKGVRASAFGETIDTNYRDWFKKQSASFQRSVLGSKKYDLYKSGKLKLNSFPDFIGTKSISLDTYKNKMGDFVG